MFSSSIKYCFKNPDSILTSECTGKYSNKKNAQHIQISHLKKRNDKRGYHKNCVHNNDMKEKRIRMQRWIATYLCHCALSIERIFSMHGKLRYLPYFAAWLCCPRNIYNFCFQLFFLKKKNSKLNTLQFILEGEHKNSNN